MDPIMLNGKHVIDTEALIIGDVCGIELDMDSWKTTSMCVTLTSQAKALGYVRPRFFGKVHVNIPIEDVASVRDIVSLNKSLSEIQGRIELRDKIH